MSSEISAELKEGLFVASGETHPALAYSIADIMGVQLGKVTLKTHPNTETYVRYDESVQGKQVIIIQPHAPANGKSVYDSFHQNLEMIYAARLAKAKSITAVSPNIAGARQDRKAREGEAVSIALNLRMMALAGASRIVTVNLHSEQTQAIFDAPFDHLDAEPMVRNELATRITGDPEEYIMVSPDIGHSKAAAEHAELLGIDVVHMDKSRDASNPTKIIRRQQLIPEVKDRTCLIIDDMIDTAGTLQSAADVLHRSEAKAIYVAAIHAWFSDPAIERLVDSPINEILVTDTLPPRPEAEALGSRLTVLSVASLIGTALIENVTEDSVSQILKDRSISNSE